MFLTDPRSVNLKRRIDKNFYQRDVLTVAKEILGKLFVKTNDKSIWAAKIVEAEAYKGSIDKAAHSFVGRTERNSVMFEDGGLLYVYFIYGIHYCANIVTGKRNEGDAVLIRAAEPVLGINDLIKNRFQDKSITPNQFINLTNGPAKFCKSFDIGKKENGLDLFSSNIFLVDFENVSESQIGISKRIGITKSKNLQWRFFIKDNRFVSTK